MTDDQSHFSLIPPWHRRAAASGVSSGEDIHCDFAVTVITQYSGVNDVGLCLIFSVKRRQQAGTGTIVV